MCPSQSSRFSEVVRHTRNTPQPHIVRVGFSGVLAILLGFRGNFDAIAVIKLQWLARDFCRSLIEDNCRLWSVWTLDCGHSFLQE